MDINKLSKQLKNLFSENDLNQLGKELRFSKRNRDITPYRLALAYMEALSCGKIESIADIQRAFNALFGTNVQYKPFHNQIAKTQFGEFMRKVFELLLEALTCKALHFSDDSPFSRFDHIVLQDGTSFSVHRELETIYPGRFKQKGPAAVELHVSMELLTESLEQVVLSPDTFAEAQFLPNPKNFTNSLIMGDRGYFKTDYFYQVIDSGEHFIIKGKSSINPLVKQVITADGKKIKSWSNQPLKALKNKFRKNASMDMDIVWKKGKKHIECRLLVTWNPELKAFQYLTTNLSREEFTTSDIIEAYRLRWQIELLFKEWKSYANLTSIKTRKESIVDGHIWASLCSATLKRYFSHVAQKMTKAHLSTRKVSMCIHHYLTDIFRALIHNPRRLKKCLSEAIIFLSNNAKRDSDKQDKKNGRAKLGLEFDFSFS